ncbi:hypothetical protein Leryth_014071 [Lithospermum erythrorhizon]|nr:hypothetical protein Leryth_014071 [Lithospermum erythrorhizon]
MNVARFSATSLTPCSQEINYDEIVSSQSFMSLSPEVCLCLFPFMLSITLKTNAPPVFDSLWNRTPPNRFSGFQNRNRLFKAQTNDSVQTLLDRVDRVWTDSPNQNNTIIHCTYQINIMTDPAFCITLLTKYTHHC